MKIVPLNVVLIVLLLLTSCSIPKYSTVRVDFDSLHVNRKPSSIVVAYDPSLAESWNYTYSRCVQIKLLIDQEIDLRQNRLNVISKWFSGIGGGVGFSTAIYALVVVNPAAAVVGVLGLFSGSAFATAFGFAKNDTRADGLIGKSKNLETMKTQAEVELTKLETLIANKKLLVYSGKADIQVEGKVPDQEVLKKYYDIEAQITVLRNALSAWDNEAK